MTYNSIQFLENYYKINLIMKIFKNDGADYDGADYSDVDPFVPIL